MTGDSFVRVLLNVSCLQVGPQQASGVHKPRMHVACAAQQQVLAFRCLSSSGPIATPCCCLSAQPPLPAYPPTLLRSLCQADVSGMLLERVAEFVGAEGEEAPLPQLILGQFRWWVLAGGAPRGAGALACTGGPPLLPPACTPPLLAAQASSPMTILLLHVELSLVSPPGWTTWLTRGR